jgi:hypothetical protein
MQWVTDGTWPHFPGEWEQISILIVAMIATVLSWDGYLVSIGNKPLFGFWRFAIDLVLVFIYMFLLMTSGHPNLWLAVICVIFVLYVVWDALTIREHIQEYDGKAAASQVTIGQIAKIYAGGFLNKEGIRRGPIITLSWTIYFLLLAMLYYFRQAQYQIFATCFFACAGLIYYRLDKVRPQRGGVSGYDMLSRAAIIFVLLLAATVYFVLWPM